MKGCSILCLRYRQIVNFDLTKSPVSHTSDPLSAEHETVWIFSVGEILLQSQARDFRTFRPSC